MSKKKKEEYIMIPVVDANGILPTTEMKIKVGSLIHKILVSRKKKK